MPVPLSRAATGRAAALPAPFPGLTRSKFAVQIRRGQLHMLAGPPGSGKTMVALIAAIRMAVPTLYISADSDEDTMAARAAAAITGHPIRDVAETIQHGLFVEEYGPVVEHLPIRFVFDPSEPSIEDIAHAHTAWLEVHGTSPHLIVVDNLLNMRGEDGNEWQAMRQSCKDLQYFARKTKSAVVLLHHTSESDKDHIEAAPPRSAIQGKVSQLPAVILTVASKDSELFVAVVKNRHGAADPMARNSLRWIVDWSTCRIWDEPLSTQLTAAGIPVSA
jgi:predicted ATP-dependent serine protease